jgi:hypothetical protein
LIPGHAGHTELDDSSWPEGRTRRRIEIALGTSAALSFAAPWLVLALYLFSLRPRRANAERIDVTPQNAQILDGIDYERFKAHPKMLCGYSDIAHVCNAVMRRAEVVTYCFWNTPRMEKPR